MESTITKLNWRTAMFLYVQASKHAAVYPNMHTEMMD